MRFTIHQGSRQGPRPYNQDRLAYSYSKEALLLVLADGMGGHRHGEVAAQLAVKTLTESFQNVAKPTIADPGRFLEEQIMGVHESIGTFAADSGLLDSPRTTLVTAMIQKDSLFFANVGDSRLYYFRDNKLLYKTEDHSVVYMMYRKGMLNWQEMQEHPLRHKIYSCVGGEVKPKIDIGRKSDMKQGDMLLLCTDGLWSVISDDEMADILFNYPMAEAVTELLDLAESRSQTEGDNMSAIGLQWGDSNHRLEISTVTMPLTSTTTILNPTYQQTQGGGAAKAADLTDDEIEKAIAEIQAALQKNTRQG